MHGSAQRGAAGVTLPLSLQNPPASSSASWGRGSRVAKRAALVLASVGVLAHRLRPSESASGVLPRKRGRSASGRPRPDKPRSSVGNAMHRIEAGTGRERRRGNRTFWRLSPARFSRTSRRSCGTRTHGRAQARQCDAEVRQYIYASAQLLSRCMDLVDRHACIRVRPKSAAQNPAARSQAITDSTGSSADA